MFKKTKEPQLDIFSSPSGLFSGKSQRIYDDEAAWHNQFRQQVTLRIDENIFKPLYSSDNGTPNASVRLLISMMVLKEAEGLSDQKLFENCRFNMLTRSAIGLLNANASIPTESTYYLFRKRIMDYANAGNANLLEAAFAQVTKGQCVDFEVSGKRIRMDSKLLGSNIAWLSRYELIHETLRLFYNLIKEFGGIDKATTAILDELLGTEGYKVVYTCSGDEIKTRLQKLGELIYHILPLFPNSTEAHYQTLERVFNEQFSVDENKIVIGKKNEEITAQSVQSPHDTDCTYRNKDGNKVKGYSLNITESCDDGDVLNLIGNIDVRVVSAPDLNFFQHDTDKVQQVFTDKIENAHVDGAYHSPDNQQYCKNNTIALHLHAITGPKGRYDLVASDDKLSITDTLTNEQIDSIMLINNEGIIRWRIKTGNRRGNGYRYFDQKDIDTCLIRRKIAQTPIEVLQKRNNVEATVFQVGYHYPNDKTRYRGLVKHQMWANIRCFWVNFVRIINFIEKTTLKTAFFAIMRFAQRISMSFHSLFDTLTTICLSGYLLFQKNQYSCF
jgi:hypothetical protein